MKKGKFLLASTLLICFGAQYALPVFASEHNDVYNSGDHTVTLHGEASGSITNNGTGSVNLETDVGNRKFTGSLKNKGGGKFTNKVNVTVSEGDVIENTGELI